MNQTMDQVARALSRVARIYTSHDGTARPLAFTDLDDCVFERGASVLRKPDGGSCSGLTIERAELRAGIEVLKNTGVRF